MKEITEDYVNFEVAKLLKEKGFDGDCQYCYIDEDDSDTEQLEIPTGYDAEIAAPTLQMAMKWLREVHNKHCDTGYDVDLKWFFQIIDLKEIVEYDYHETIYYHSENDTGLNSYEEACEAAIKYCLEIL